MVFRNPSDFRPVHPLLFLRTATHFLALKIHLEGRILPLTHLRQLFGQTK